MNAFQSGWYLIYTKPRHEKKLHSHLAERNVNCFLPTKKTLRTWHDRRKYIDEPLFPSYVFIYLNDMQNYYDGIDADGFLYYVRSGKEIARVKDIVINNIRLATEHTNDIELSDERFRVGKQLVISKGALTGLSCEIVQCHNRYKLLVRVDLLKRNLLLTMPEDHLLIL
jgi:transcriptional antiterminator RfaH